MVSAGPWTAIVTYMMYTFNLNFNMVPPSEMPNTLAMESKPLSPNVSSGSLSTFFQVQESGPIGAPYTHTTLGDDKRRATANPDDMAPDNTTEKFPFDAPLLPNLLPPKNRSEIKGGAEPLLALIA